MGKTLGKRGLVAAGAVAVQAKSTWLVSGATVILNFLMKSMPRMGPAIAACKHLAVNSLQKFGCKQLALKLDGFGNKIPRGDWLAICSLKQRVRWTSILDVQGTILNVAPVSTK